MLDGAQFSASTFGNGNAGEVLIEATDTILFSGTDPAGIPSGAFGRVGLDGSGNAGDVRVVARTVRVLDGAQLDASTFGEGNAGTVSVEATDTVTFSGFAPQGSLSGAFGRVGLEGRGNAGGIRIATHRLEILDGARLSASTFGEGTAGALEIEATGSVIFSDARPDDSISSGAFSQVGRGRKGKCRQHPHRD